MRRLAVPLFAIAGCLQAPEAAPVECKVQDDCDTANGEVCEEGVCWGNPPAGPFAALITPPSKLQNDIVAAQLRLETLPADGYFGDFALEEPVRYSGQIVCPSECSTGTTFGATILVTRRSIFLGGPEFRQVFTADAATGSFQLVLPRVRPGEPPYVVTINPAGTDRPGNTPTLAELVPPLFQQLTLDNDQNAKTIDLGGEAPLFTISGTIVDFQDNPATNYRVVALGRWLPDAPLTAVSTVDFIGQTGGNQFSIRLSENVIGPVEIVAQPFGNPLRPTLHRTVTPVGTVSSNNRLVIPDLGGGGQPLAVVVAGTGTGGGVEGVLGAHVRVTGKLGTQTATTEARFVVEGNTDASGVVTLMVPGGDFAGTYNVSVAPPANSTSGVLFNHKVESVPGTTQLKLPDRLALVGTVLDVNGNPLKDVQVTARPSLRFEWSLAADPQAFVGGIPAATTLTPDTGEFVLFVDPFLDDGDIDVWGFYDLEIEPTTTTNAPAISLLDIEIPRDTTLSRLEIPTTVLPDAAHIHGRLVDPFGETVDGAELKLFRIESEALFAQYCGQLSNPPPSCPIPAQLLGRGLSDQDGIARVTLPR